MAAVRRSWCGDTCPCDTQPPYGIKNCPPFVKTGGAFFAGYQLPCFVYTSEAALLIDGNSITNRGLCVNAAYPSRYAALTCHAPYSFFRYTIASLYPSKPRPMNVFSQAMPA